MSDCVRMFKTYIRTEEQIFYQNLAKSYSKTYAALMENKSAGLTNLSDTTNSQSSSVSQTQSTLYASSNNFNGELIKEKVLRWFFSLPLESRIKVATVENALLTCMIHQMNFRYKCDRKVVFQFKPESTNEESQSKEKYSIKVGCEGNYISEDELYQLNILNFLNWKSNRDATDHLVENIWLGDVRFYTLHCELDAMTLSPRVLKDEGLFNYYFKYIGSSKSFFSLIKPDVRNKQYSYHLPDWFDPKEYYSVSQFIAAHIEQAILIKYVLNHTKKDKFTFSLHNEKKMNEFFTKRKEVLGCLAKHFNNENKRELFNYISPRRIFNDIYYDRTIEKSIHLKNRHVDVGYQSFVSRKAAGKTPCFYGTNDMETESKIINKYLHEHFINFVDDSLYHGLDSIWKENYYLSKRLFEDLHCLYTDKNYEELVNDMSESKETKKGSNKKGKKKEIKGKESSVQSIQGNSTNTKKKKGTKNEESSVSTLVSLTDDPDYEYYSSYLKEAKSQTHIVAPQKNTQKSYREKDLEDNNDHVDTSNSINEINVNRNIDSSPAPKQEYSCESVSKGYLQESYDKGRKNMIKDFVENIILGNIINSVVEISLEKNKNIATSNSGINDLLSDLSKINAKSKLINQYLTKSNNSVKINQDQEKSFVNKNLAEDGKLQKNKDSLLNENNLISIDSKEINEFSLNTKNEPNSLIEDQKDIVNYISIEDQCESVKIIKPNENLIVNNDENLYKESLINDNEKLESNDSIEKINSNSNSNNNEVSENSSEGNSVQMSNTQNKKKKKKEPNFFLYDTTRKRKDLKENTTSNNNSTKTDSNNTNSSIINSSSNSIQNNNKTQVSTATQTKRNSNNNLENDQTKKNDTATLKINTQEEKLKKGNSPSFSKVSSSNPSNPSTTPHSHTHSHSLSNSHQSQLEYRQGEFINTGNTTNPIKKNNFNSNSNNPKTTTHRETRERDLYRNNNNYYQGDSPRGKYKSGYNYNNYNHNRGYYKREASAKVNSDNMIQGNNYYIFNSVTHVNNGGMVSPMMMYGNPPQMNHMMMSPFNMMPGLNSLNHMSPLNPISPINSHISSNSNMSNIVSNINMNKYSNDFLTFVYKLHNDIVSYHRNVTETLEAMKEVKVYVIQSIEKLIKQNISDNFSIDVYGSFASDLSIESSDIDIKIRLKAVEETSSDSASPQMDLEQMIMLLVKNFNSLNLFESVIPIYTASVPIVKIVVDPAKIADDENLMRLEEFRNCEHYKNYKFNKEELDKIKVDITFLDMIVKYPVNFGNNNCSTLMSSVEFAKNKLILYPEIKPLLQVLKRYLQIKKMNSCFNGNSKKKV
jgi:predicted nucleotidyltransferase